MEKIYPGYMNDHSKEPFLGAVVPWSGQFSPREESKAFMGVKVSEAWSSR